MVDEPTPPTEEPQQRLWVVEMHVDKLEQLRQAMANGDLSAAGIKRRRLLDPLPTDPKDHRSVEILRSVPQRRGR